MKSVVYAGSFDLIQLWHVDIAKRAGKLIEWLWWEDAQLVLWLWQNEKKKSMFEMQANLHLARKALLDVFKWTKTSFVVENYSWTIYDYLFSKGSRNIIRWLRNAQDFTEAQTFEHAIKSQDAQLEVTYLFADPKHQFTSSTISKIFLNYEDRIEEHVPLSTKQFAEATHHQKYIGNLSAKIWGWKSFITDAFVDIGKEEWVPLFNQDLDEQAANITNKHTWKGYKRIREELNDNFWWDVLDDQWMMDRKKVGSIVFQNPEKMKSLNSIMREPIRRELIKEMKGKKGLHIINAALTAEAWISQFGNNITLLIDVDKEIQEKRLRWRGYSDEMIKNRIESQYTTKWKHQILEKDIQKYNNAWEIIPMMNNDASPAEIKKKYFDFLAATDVDGRLRFHSVLHRLGTEKIEVGHDLKHDMYEWLRDRLLENARYYHNLFHIIEFLKLFNQVRDKFTIYSREEVEMAIRLHDYYLWTGHEEKSAKEVERFWKIYWRTDKFVKNVQELILATNMSVEAQNEDQALFADLDRSILAKEGIEFNLYRHSIRAEYPDATDEQFRDWSIDFFQGIIDKSIFQSKYGKNMFEDKARVNAIKELHRLRATG